MEDNKPIESTEPEIGTYAYTAMVMAKICPDFDWDAWKDEMKESE